jgi:DNA polymerase
MITAAAHDFETRSAADLKKTGVDAYAEHPSTGLWCMSWRLPNARGCWKPGDPDPRPFLDHIERGGILTAWNAPFEMGIWYWVIRRICTHWPVPRLEQFACTMARALARALPGGLDQCAQALNLPIAKDKAGYRLMLRMCRPKTAWRRERADADRVYEATVPAPPMWHDNPADLAKLCGYCDTDVDVELSIGDRIPELTPEERENWLLNERVNRRGIRLDLPLVAPALAIVTRETARLNTELKQLTDGASAPCLNAPASPVASR